MRKDALRTAALELPEGEFRGVFNEPSVTSDGLARNAGCIDDVAQAAQLHNDIALVHVRTKFAQKCDTSAHAVQPSAAIVPGGCGCRVGRGLMKQLPQFVQDH